MKYTAWWVYGQPQCQPWCCPGICSVLIPWLRGPTLTTGQSTWQRLQPLRLKWQASSPRSITLHHYHIGEGVFHEVCTCSVSEHEEQKLLHLKRYFQGAAVIHQLGYRLCSTLRHMTKLYELLSEN